MELGTVAYATVTVALVTATRPLLRKKKILPLLSSSKGQFLSLAANCKPGNTIKTGKALQSEFPLVTADQMVSVNGCGHSPCLAKS